jgi:hypothetical protein
MPVIVTFDVERPTSLELNRLRGVFERLGWEHLGNTAYRYPMLHERNKVEDWFNHVIPALMLLRAFARHAVDSGRSVTKFSLDVQSSTGFNPLTEVGTLPLAGDETPLSPPSSSGEKFGEQRLRDWLDGVKWPY